MSSLADFLLALSVAMSVLCLFLHGNTIFPPQYPTVRIRSCTQDLRHKSLPLELEKSLLQARREEWAGTTAGEGHGREPWSCRHAALGLGWPPATKISPCPATDAYNTLVYIVSIYIGLIEYIWLGYSPCKLAF